MSRSIPLPSASRPTLGTTPDDARDDRTDQHDWDELGGASAATAETPVVDPDADSGTTPGMEAPSSIRSQPETTTPVDRRDSEPRTILQPLAPASDKPPTFDTVPPPSATHDHDLALAARAPVYSYASFEEYERQLEASGEQPAEAPPPASFDALPSIPPPAWPVLAPPAFVYDIPASPKLPTGLKVPTPTGLTSPKSEAAVAAAPNPSLRVDTPSVIPLPGAKLVVPRPNPGARPASVRPPPSSTIPSAPPQSVSAPAPPPPAVTPVAAPAPAPPPPASPVSTRVPSAAPASARIPSAAPGSMRMPSVAPASTSMRAKSVHDGVSITELHGADSARRDPLDGYSPKRVVSQSFIERHADTLEKELLDQGRLPALIEMLQGRAERASRADLAPLYTKIGILLEREGKDLLRAFDAFLLAFDIEPTSEEAAAGVERTAARLGAWDRAADRAEERLEEAAPDERAHVLAALARLSEKAQRPHDAEKRRQELRAIDGAHPALLLLDAEQAKKVGDSRREREMLERALARIERPETKARIYVLLARVPGSSKDEQIGLYESAYALDPTSVGALAALERLGLETERHAMVAFAQRGLGILSVTPEERASAWIRYAELLERRFLRREAAASAYERALGENPASNAALVGLERCYHALRDWPKLAEATCRRAERSRDPKTRWSLFSRAAEVFELKAHDNARAFEAMEQARVVLPHDGRTLATLVRLASSLERWPEVALYKSELAAEIKAPKPRAIAFVELGQLLHRMGDIPGAEEAFEEASRVDPTNEVAQSMAIESLVRKEQWSEAAALCAVAIGTKRTDTKARIRLLRLAMRVDAALGDVEKAAKTALSALEIAPSDLAVWGDLLQLLGQVGAEEKLIAELHAPLRSYRARAGEMPKDIALALERILSLATKPPKAATMSIGAPRERARERDEANPLERIAARIAADPSSPELYDELYTRALDAHAYDRAWCAVNVLGQLHGLTAAQTRFLADWAAVPSDRIPGRVPLGAWRTHLFHERLPPEIAAIFLTLAPWLPALAKAGGTAELSSALPPISQTRSSTARAAHDTFEHLSDVLGLPPPTLLAVKGASSQDAFVRGTDPHVVAVNMPAVKANMDRLPFLVGRCLAESVPAIAARAVHWSATELTLLARAAVHIGQGAPSYDAIGGAILRELSSDAKRAIADATQGIDPMALREQVLAWSLSAEDTAIRAGLLVCGDVSVARRFLLDEREIKDGRPPPDRRIFELYRFATSARYGELRNALGITVEQRMQEDASAP